MKRKKVPGYLVALSVVAISLGVFLLIWITSISEDKVRSWIAADLPLGSTKEEVIAFCERRGMTHSGYYKPELYYAKSRSISASIPIRDFWIKSGVYVTFQFDENDRLVGYDVRTVHTFL